MKIETTVTITADNGTLYVHADGCDGHIAIPAHATRLPPWHARALRHAPAWWRA